MRAYHMWSSITGSTHSSCHHGYESWSSIKWFVVVLNVLENGSVLAKLAYNVPSLGSFLIDLGRFIESKNLQFYLPTFQNLIIYEVPHVILHTRLSHFCARNIERLERLGTKLVVVHKGCRR